MNIYEQIEEAIFKFETKWNISVTLIRLCEKHQKKYTRYINKHSGFSSKFYKGKSIIQEVLNDTIERCIVCEEL